MTPVERAARALEELVGADGILWASPEQAVRAVIAAIREPSEVMCARGGEVPEMGSIVRRGAAYSSYQAMIDALLAEEE